eukprot:scaffold47246_cov81-Phaeocystis_antarctica.AAC.10
MENASSISKPPIFFAARPVVAPKALAVAFRRLEWCGGESDGGDSRVGGSGVGRGSATVARVSAADSAQCLAGESLAASTWSVVVGLFLEFCPPPRERAPDRRVGP